MALIVTIALRLRKVAARLIPLVETPMPLQTKKPTMNFEEMRQVDVPRGRSGKHKDVISRILSDLERIKHGAALKVPLAQLTSSKERVRSALNRESRKRGLHVATASDGVFLYVWNGTS
jgi:hypothetical protein